MNTFLDFTHLNFLSQNWHLNGFSPVCISSCFFNWLGWINLLSQTSHLNLCEFSSLMWVLSWCFKCDGSLKAFSQNLHGKGLSPVWTFSWFLKLPGFWNFFSQYLHEYFLLHSFTCLAKSRTSEEMHKMHKVLQLWITKYFLTKYQLSVFYVYFLLRKRNSYWSINKSFLS